MGGVVGGIVGTVGGLISGGKAADAAKGQAEALRAAGQRASEMAMFRPVGITTGFGRSRFTVDDLGRVTEAGYELTPELQSLRNRILGLATGGGFAPRTPSVGLFNTLAPQVPEGYSLEAPPGYMGTAVIPRQGFQYAYSPSGERIEVPLVSQPAPVVGGFAPRFTGPQTGGPGIGPEGLFGTPETIMPSSGGLPDAYSIGEQLAPIGAAASRLFGLGGQLLPTSISRTASPEALALQQRYQQAATGLAPTDLSMAASPEALALSQQLRGLSQQVTPTSYDPTAAAQQYFEQQRSLLEPSRQAQLSQTRSRLFGTGRGGLGVTTATGGAPTSPELQAYYNAIAQQDRELAARSTDVARQRLAEDIALGTQLSGTALTTQQRAEDIARQRTLGNLQTSLGYGGQAVATGLAGEDVARQRFAQDLGLGTGLFGTAGQFLSQIPALQSAYLGPIESQLGLARMIESMGIQPFALSQELASAQSGAGRGAASAYLQPQEAAARSYAQYQGYSPMGSFLSGAGSALGGMGGGGGSLSRLFSNPNQYGGFFGGGQVPTSSSGFESWGSPYIS